MENQKTSSGKSPKVIGTTHDGVEVLAPAVPSKNFTPEQVREAIAKAKEDPSPVSNSRGIADLLKDGFMVCTAEMGRAFVKIDFQTLAQAQALHSALTVAAKDSLVSIRSGIREAFKAGWEMNSTAGAEDEWEDAFSYWSGEDDPDVAIDQATIDRVAAALKSADIGHDMSLTRLVDGIHTYTLTIRGEIETFVDNDDADAIDQAYARIREVKYRLNAEAVIAALSATATEGE